jgi:hypothetical protein
LNLQLARQQTALGLRNIQETRKRTQESNGALAYSKNNKQARDPFGRFIPKDKTPSTIINISPTEDTILEFTDYTRTPSRLSESYDFIVPTPPASTPFTSSPTFPFLPLPTTLLPIQLQIPTETEDMAETVTPFHGDKEDECPEFFLRAFYRRMSDKTDESKKAQFAYYLHPYSVADEWYSELVDDEKKSWGDIVKAFQKRWPKRIQVKKTKDEYEDEVLGRKLKVEDLGKKEKIAGMEVYSHVAWADKMAASVKGAKLEKTTTHIRQVRKDLPTMVREKIGTTHANWEDFLKTVREIDIEYIRDSIDIQDKQQAAIDQRFRMYEAVSNSPTAPLRHQLSTVAISSTRPSVPNATAVGDPFANSGGGQGNLRFATNPAALRQARPPFTGPNPRPPPTLEQKEEISTLLSKYPHHPDTQAGRQAHQAQQADWVRTYGYGTRITEKTPYPLRPGTAPVNSGECFTCGQIGHLGTRTGESCVALGYRVLHPNEQQWRVICSRILRQPKVTTNVHFVAVDDYGTTLQDIQGNGEGPSA